MPVELLVTDQKGQAERQNEEVVRAIGYLICFPLHCFDVISDIFVRFFFTWFACSVYNLSQLDLSNSDDTEHQMIHVLV